MQCVLSDNTPDCDHKGKLLSLLLFPGVDDLGPFQKQATLIKAYRRKVVAIVRIYSGMLEPWAWGAISPPGFDQALVTQPMLQRQPNCTE